MGVLVLGHGMIQYIMFGEVGHQPMPHPTLQEAHFWHTEVH